MLKYTDGIMNTNELLEAKNSLRLLKAKKS